MTTTEDNKDQEARELRRVLELTVSDPDEFLETLALAGYTVVKTGDVRVAQAIAAARVADRKCDWRVPESDTECGGLDG